MKISLVLITDSSTMMISAGYMSVKRSDEDLLGVDD
jgi:hypothetical protein